MQASDEALMAQVQAGDREAFGALHDRWRPGLLRFLIRLTGDATLSEDLTQETLLRLWSARDRWKPGTPLRPWLLAIARNVARNALARGPQRRERPLGDALTVAMEERGATEAVASALQALPEAQRVALVLTVYEGFTFREVGVALGCTELAARALAFRARRSLRRTLTDWLESEGETEESLA